jgi:hypothetical protein
MFFFTETTGRLLLLERSEQRTGRGRPVAGDLVARDA